MNPLACYDDRVREVLVTLEGLQGAMEERGLAAAHSSLFDALQPAQTPCWTLGDLQRVITEARAAVDQHDRFWAAFWRDYPEWAPVAGCAA